MMPDAHTPVRAAALLTLAALPGTGRCANSASTRERSVHPAARQLRRPGWKGGSRRRSGARARPSAQLGVRRQLPAAQISRICKVAGLPHPDYTAVHQAVIELHRELAMYSW